MPIDIDILSFSELNANATDINGKVNSFQDMALNPVPAGSNNKIAVRRSTGWSIEGEEAYNGQFQEMGNISGDVVLELNTTTSRTAIIATITGYTFVTSFGVDMLTSHVYTIFLKQNSTGNYAVRWPYGASVLNMVGPDPNQVTAVYVVKLPSGKIFVKCEAFQNTVEIGGVIKEFQPPTITYPDEGNAPIGFTWSKMPEIAHGGTLSGLYSDWEVASDELFTVLMFSSYGNTVDLYSIEVVLSRSGLAYMRTRYGGEIGGTPVVSPWEQMAVQVSGVPPLWTPADIDTALWLDASDNSKIIDSGGVSQWLDKSGNNRHAVPATVVKPVYSSSGINSLGSVVFAAGTDPLLVPSFAPPTGAAGLLVAFVAEKNGEPVDYSNPLTFGAVNAQWSFILSKAGVGAANGENRCWFRNRAADASHVLSVNNYGVNVPRLVVGTIKDADGMALLFDGNIEATRAAATHILGDAAALTIGSSSDSSYSANRFQGRVGEILIVYGDVSGTTRTKIEGYLAHRWGLTAALPSDHPYKYAPPRKFAQDTWTPAEITTALWLDGADSDTITLNGSTVSQWADKSGNARHATQATAGAQPTLETNRLSFDGGDHLSVADVAGLQFGTGDFAVVIVANITNVSKGPAAQNTLISKNYFGFELYNYQGSLGGYLGGTGAGASITGLTSGAWGIFSQVRMSSSHTVRRTGTASTAATNSASASQAGQAIIIGARPGFAAAYFLVGKESEIIVLPQGFTAATLQMIEGYLAHKWDALLGVTTLVDALPSDHPYKTAAHGTKYVTDNTALISGNLLEGTTGLTISQVNSDPLNVGIDVAGSNGGLFRIYANGSWTFDPNSEFGALFYPDTADTSVTYHASDGVSEAMATLTITVVGVVGQMSLSDAITSLAPTAYWRFDEASGLTAADEMGAYAMTHPSSGIVVGDAPLLSAGKSVQYTGGSTRSIVSGNIIPNSGNTGPVSFVFVFKNAAAKQALFWDKQNTATNTRRIFLGINRDHSAATEVGKFCIFTSNEAGGFGNVAMTTADARVNDGHVHLLCVVRDGTTAKIYIDGDDLPVSGTLASGVLHDGTGHVLGNVNAGGTTLSCSMTLDDTAVFYNRALTASDVAELYSAFQASK